MFDIFDVLCLILHFGSLILFLDCHFFFPISLFFSFFVSIKHAPLRTRALICQNSSKILISRSFHKF